MYLHRMISEMQKENVTMDYLTGATESQYHSKHHQSFDITDLNAVKNCDEAQGEFVLNAIFNYTDDDKSALVHDQELNQVLEKFSFDETIDIALGLGIDIPIQQTTK